MSRFTPLDQVKSDEEAQLITEFCGAHRHALNNHLSPTWTDDVRRLPANLQATAVFEVMKTEILIHEQLTGCLLTLYELRVKYPQAAKVLTKLYHHLPPDLTVPDKLKDEYQILKMVKSSGQAQLLLANKIGYSQSVAIKLAQSVSQNDRLNLEAHLLNSVVHPHIAKCQDFGTYQGRRYLVMEYYEGDNFRDHVRKTEPDPLVATRMILQIAKAVAHLHALKIAHRDIKPDNCFWDESGHARLLDLGCAVSFNEAMQPRRSLPDNDGTPAYRSPEQTAGREDADAELGDIYALGATLYFLLTQKHPSPVQAEGNAQSFTQFQKPRPDNCPPRLWSLCEKARAISPKERYSRASDLVADLETSFNEALVSQTGRGKSWPRRVGLVAGAAALSAIILAMPSLLSLFEPARDMAGSTQLEPSPPPVRAVKQTSNKVIVPDVETEEPENTLTIEQTGKPKANPPQQPQEPQQVQAKDSWYRKLAAEQGIDLSKITAESFRLHVVIEEKSLSAGPAISYWDMYPGKLMIEVDEKLEDIANALEFRIGKRPWQQTLIDVDTGSRYGQLDNKHMASREFIQLRFDSQAGFGSGDVLGPFTYPQTVQELTETSNAHKLKQNKTRSFEADWFLCDRDGWFLNILPFYQYRAFVKEIRFGLAEDSLNHVLKLDSITTIPLKLTALFTQKLRSSSKPELEFQRALELMDFPNKLYVQFNYVDGTESRIKVLERHPIEQKPIERAKRLYPPWEEVGPYADPSVG